MHSWLKVGNPECHSPFPTSKPAISSSSVEAKRMDFHVNHFVALLDCVIGTVVVQRQKVLVRILPPSLVSAHGPQM